MTNPVLGRSSRPPVRAVAIDVAIQRDNGHIADAWPRAEFLGFSMASHGHFGRSMRQRLRNRSALRTRGSPWSIQRRPSLTGDVLSTTISTMARTGWSNGAGSIRAMA